jgi:hypothetical protein
MPISSPPPLRLDWRDRRVLHSVSWSSVVFLWGFALVWNATLLGFGWVLWTMPPRDGRGVATATLMVFAVAGLALVAGAIGTTWSRARFGRSEFALDAVPFAIGGWVSGVVHVPSAAARAESFDVVLDCLRIVPMNRGTNRSTTWREEVTVPAAGLDRDDSGVRVPVAIRVPADGFPSGTLDRRRIEWRLSIAASLPGMDYDAHFEVPVFHVGGEASPPPRPLSRLRGEGEGMSRPPGTRIQVQHLPDGLTIQYPTPKWVLSWALGPMLVFPVVGWLVGQRAYPGEWPAIVVGVAVGVAAAAVLLALTVIAVLLTPNRVEVHADEVLVRNGAYGFGYTRRVARRDVKAVKHVPVQNGPSVTHTVVMETRDGRTVMATPSIAGLTEARWLTGELERAVGTTPA